MAKPVQILYVDDSASDRLLVRDALEKEDRGFQVTEAKSQEEFEALLASQTYDLVLSDLNVGEYSGLQVIEVVRANDPSLPVIILTGSGSTEAAVEAMKQGAADYVIKTLKRIRRLPATIRNVLERKRLRQEQRENERRLRFQAQILQNVRDAIQVTDLEGRIIYWNKGAEAVFGYTEAEMLGQTLEKLYPEQNKEQFAVDLQNILAGHDYHGEWQGRHKNGFLIWIDAHTTLMRDAGGNPIGSIGVSKDITERRQSERKLREHQAQLQLVIQTAKLGLWDWNVQEDVVYYSPEWKQQLGYGEHELSKSFDELKDRLHPDDRDRIVTSLQAYLQTPWPDYQTEMRLRHRDGTYRWMLVRATLLVGDSGRPYHVLGSQIDITERKQAEQALRQSEERFRLAVNHFPYTFVIYDAERRLQFVNERGIRASGYSEEALLGRRDEELFPPEVTDGYLPILKRAVATRTPESGECTVILPTAGTSTITVNYVLILDKQGQIRQILGITYDITERKHQEEALQRYAGRLEALREIDVAILAAHSSTEIAQIAVDKLKTLVPCERTTVGLFNFEEKTITVLAVDSLKQTKVKQGLTVPVEIPNPTFDRLRQGEIVAIPDLAAIESQSPAVQALQREGLRSYMTAPLLVQGELIGTMNLGSSQADAFTAEDEEIISEVSVQLAIAIRQTRLHEQIQQDTEALKQRIADHTAELRALRSGSLTDIDDEQSPEQE